MLKKTISHIGIYLILFNLISSLLYIDIAYSENLSPGIKKIINVNKKNYSEDNVIVKFKDNTGIQTISDMKNVMNGIGVSNMQFFDKADIGVVGFNKKTKNIDILIGELKKLSNVEYVEYDYIRNISYTGVITNDTQSIEQWYLKSIQADEAWKIYNDNENKTIVSVNDTGLDYSHPELLGNLKDLSSNCKSDTGAIISGGCPNYGWNFEGSGDYNSLTAVLEENEIYDINGHGTHVAGTIGAVGNNGTGVIGVTQNVEIIGARIETYENNYGVFYVSNTIRALNFARENGAKVINASYGGTSFSQAEYDAIEVAKNNGILFIAAAGNNSANNDGATNFYPSDYNLDNIISVASIGEDDTLAYYSNYGTTSVDIAAPGGDLSGDTGILSTYPYYETIWSNNMSSFSGITLSGTGLDWNIVQGLAIETQSGSFDWNTTYTGSEDKTLTFDKKFDLSGECELQAGDNLEVLINDQVIGNAYPNWTLARTLNYGNVILPIPSNLYTAASELKIRFNTDSDTNYNYGCTLDDFSIIKYDASKHAYKSMQGTSMATPVVVGVASMIWSYKPELTYLEVKDIIFSSLDTLPSLAGKVLTSGKINAKNAIKELISRYGITKNGTFLGENYSAPNINLDSKNIILSEAMTYINLTSTGIILNLSGSTISGTGTIYYGTGTSVYNSGSMILETSSDFEMLLKDSSGSIISSGSTVYGESLILSYTGSQSGYNVRLYPLNYLINGTGLLLDGELIQNNLINIGDSFSDEVIAYVYKDGNITNGIGTGIDLYTYNEVILNNFTFNYTPSVFTGTLDFNSGSITNSTGTYVELTSTHYPVDYQITGDVVGSYTGTLNNSGSVLVELTSGDGVKTLSGVLENLANQFSQAFTGSIVLDQTVPIVTLGANTSTGTSAKSIEFSFSSGDSDFDTGSIIWSNNLNSNTGTGLTYIVSGETSTGLVATLSFSDILGNVGSIDSEAYIIDNTGPQAPTNLFLNDGGIINVSNVTNLSLSGSGNIVDSGSIINYSFNDSSEGVVDGTGILSGENFIINSLNLSSLSDGTINYSAYFTDTLGNIGSIATGSTTKETVPPTGTINLLSLTNNTEALANLTSSEYPVNYEITGDIVGTTTGTINNSGAVNIELTSGEGIKNISVEFTDLGSNISPTYTGGIMLDQTLPVLNILSHNNNEQLELSLITLTGTVSDSNGINNLIIGGTGVTILSNTFSTNINLNGGDNQLGYSLVDNAGNTFTGSINIVRTTVTSNISTSILGTDSVNIVFYTNLTSTGEVLFGINQNNLNQIANSSSGLNHNILISSLTPNTLYYYKVRGYNNSYTGSLSSLGNVITASAFDMDSYSGTTLNTGSILFMGSGATSTGAIFNSSGTLDLSSNNGDNSVILTLSGLVINTTGWDLVFNPPEQTTFSGSFTNTGYTNIELLTYNIGSENSELVLSGSTAQVNILVGASYNGQTLGVFRSIDSGFNYNYLVSCLVSVGICTFNTDAFSLFAIAAASDTTPDSFTFTDIINSELSTGNISNIITVSGINTGSIVSISNGLYSINSGTYTSSNGIINDGDTIKIKLISSSSNSTKTDSTLTIGGISDTYSITTKASSNSSNSGGGGSSGGGSSSYPTCLDVQLECRAVAGSKILFKLYKKDGFTCIGGNLGKECGESNAIQKFQTINELESSFVFKNKILEKLYNDKKVNLINVDEKISEISYLGEDVNSIKSNYINIYAKWTSSLLKIDSLIAEKNIEGAKIEFKTFLETYKTLQNFTDNLKIRSITVDGLELKYLKYSDKKIQKIQILLFGKIKKKKANIGIYKLINRVVHNLNRLLTDKTLSKDQIKKIRKETIFIYKVYIKKYTKLSNK